MPPQKATVASTTHSLRCRRRHWPGEPRSQPRRAEDRRSCTPASHQRCAEGRRPCRRAEAVDDDPHRDAAPRRALERIGDVGAAAPRSRRCRSRASTSRARRVDRRDHAREELVAALAAAAARAPRAAARRWRRPRRCAVRAPGFSQLELGDQRQVVRHARPRGARAAPSSTGSAGRAHRCGPSRTAACATERCCSAPAVAARRRARSGRRCVIGASSFSPQSLKSPATIDQLVARHLALDEAARRSTWRTRLACDQPEVRDDHVHLHAVPAAPARAAARAARSGGPRRRGGRRRRSASARAARCRARRRS